MEYAEENGGNLAANGSLAFTRKNPILEKIKRCPMTDKKVPESFHRHAPHWPDLQDKLETFVMEQRAACIALNTVQLRLK